MRLVLYICCTLLLDVKKTEIVLDLPDRILFLASRLCEERECVWKERKIVVFCVWEKEEEREREGVLLWGIIQLFVSMKGYFFSAAAAAAAARVYRCRIQRFEIKGFGAPHHPVILERKTKKIFQKTQSNRERESPLLFNEIYIGKNIHK